jgi:hypothetical protein
MTDGMSVLVGGVCEVCEIKARNLPVQIACGIHPD